MYDVILCLYGYILSHIQIKVMLYLFIAWCVGKAVYCCARAVQCRSAVLVLGECLIYNGHGCAWASLGIGHASGSAMLLVPDIPLTDKKQ